MASETISTDTNWTGLASTKAHGETITINSGATLTMDQTIDAQGIADAEIGTLIVCISGFSTFAISNTSTTTAVRYYGADASTLRFESGSNLNVSGDYII